MHLVLHARPLRLLLAFLITLFVAGSSSASVPAGFQDVEVAGGIDQPSVLAFAPDGRLFVGEKASGQIRIIEDGTLLAAPFLDLNDFIPSGKYFDFYFERGLLGIAFHPDFANKPFVYVYYTICKVPGTPAQPGTGTCKSAKNRVARFRATGDTVDSASHTVILDDIASDAGNHNGGWIGFGPTDGKLYVAVGDGASSANAQSAGVLNGKILRLNADGTIPADNPLVGQAGKRGEIWALGLRNPFRCRFAPNGRLFCGDVGNSTWEEVDIVARNANYGWATTEGPFDKPTYPQFTHPIHWYNHGGQRSAVIGGDFGVRTNFPGDYQQSYFVGDFERGWIQRLVLDASGTGVASVKSFATGLGDSSVTDIVAGPDGSLYYTNYAANSVHRVIAFAGNRSPVAQASATPAQGNPPLAVKLSSAGSSDPDGDALTFRWDFGDGSAVSTAASPTHTYQQAGSYTATLTVDDGKAVPGPASDSVTIDVGHPPALTIAAPLDGAVFRAGDTIALAGSATDPEDGPLPPAALHWQIVFHHRDHTHPFIDDLAGAPQSFTAATTGETDYVVGYEIILRATDSDGLTAARSVMIVPQLVDLAVTSDPPGLDLALDGQPQTAPFTFTSVVGFIHTLGAPSPQSDGSVEQFFVDWSDGGASFHTVTTPPVATTYTATFTSAHPCTQAVVVPPAGGIFTGTTSGSGLEAGPCGNALAAPETVFQWTPAFSGTATIETCGGGTDYDTVLYLRQDGCTPGTPAGCNDDACPDATGANHGSRITRSVTAGEPYYIFVDGFGGAHGNFTLRVVPPPGPPGNCGNPIAIPASGGTLSGTATGASLESGTCGRTDVSPEMVYQWTPQRSGTATIETCGTGTNYDTVVYLRDGGCTDGSAQIRCNDDTVGCATGEPSASHGSRISVDVAAGETYFIAVDGYAGDQGAFDLTVKPPEATAPTSTPAPAATATPTPARTATTTKTVTPGATATPLATRTPTPSKTATPAATSAPTRTATPLRTPTATPAAATTPTEPTPAVTPAAASGCSPAPETGCRRPAVARKALLLIRSGADEGRDLLIWKWLRGAATLKDEFRSRDSATDHQLCLYDERGLVSSVAVPAAGVCDGEPCWRETASGFKYAENALPVRLLTIAFQEGTEPGRAKITLKQRGGLPGLPSLSTLMAPVTVQLRNERTCWEAVYSGPFIMNAPDRFKAKAD